MKPDNLPGHIREKALGSSSRIILPETGDARVVASAEILAGCGVNLVEPEDFYSQSDRYREYLCHRSFTRNWPDELVDNFLKDAVNFAAMMVALGDADGMIAGAATPREDLLRTAIRVLGVRKDYKFVFSSIFLTAPDNSQNFSFADCGVIPEPKALELAGIAGHTALYHHWLTGVKPQVAFISFSTKGDLQHYRVDRVIEAMGKFRRKFPRISFEGEVQVDAALSAKAAEHKGADLQFGGKANVLIFPNLDAGNTAWKITERLAGYAVTGPKLHGLNHRLNLVSRTCSIDTIVNTTLLTLAEEDYYANLQLQM